MNLNSLNIELYSEYPLFFINDEGVVEVLENIYSSEEVIRVYNAEMEIESSYDTEITGSITLVPQIGTMFFRDQIDATRFKSLFATEEGREAMVQTYQEMMRFEKKDDYYTGNLNCVNGLYSFPQYDQYIHAESDLLELRYLDYENTIRKIKTVTPELENYIDKYVQRKTDRFCEAGANKRIIFELYQENGKIYIEGFNITENMLKNGVVFISKINNFPLFRNKIEAGWYRYNMKTGDTLHNYAIDEPNVRYEQMNIMESKRLAKINNMKSLAQGLWQVAQPYVNLSTILNFAISKMKK